VNQKASLLSGEAICRTDFESGAPLLRDVTFSLAAGDWLSLAGPSGAGKTVLLRAVALLDTLQSGRVLWQGKPIEPVRTPAYRARVVYLHQRAAMFEGTVEENLRLPFGLQVHRETPWDRTAATTVLREFGREIGFITKAARDLSGGEMQLVALVRVLLLRPQVLLLDEATASLDRPTADLVQRRLRDWLSAEADRAIVWVSHDEEAAVRYATAELRLKHGQMTGEK
jgi:putative ABC transport system ATP-binding protein